MSFMDKFLNAIQLNGEEDGYYDEPDEAYTTSKVESINNSVPIGKDDPSIEINNVHGKGYRLIVPNLLAD